MFLTTRKFTSGGKQQVANATSKGKYDEGTLQKEENQIQGTRSTHALSALCCHVEAYQQVRIQQNKAARYVHQDWQRTSSVTAMKEALCWLSLQNGRLMNRLTFMHKTTHGQHGYLLLAPPYVQTSPKE